MVSGVQRPTKRAFAGRTQHSLLLSGLPAAAAALRRTGRATLVGLLPGWPEKSSRLHDENSQVSYLETLRIYLDNNLSVTKTAVALYLHRSTLLDRLAHITQMLGCDLKNPDFCLTLGILLRAELQQKRFTQAKP